MKQAIILIDGIFEKNIGTKGLEFFYEDLENIFRLYDFKGNCKVFTNSIKKTEPKIDHTRTKTY